MEARESIVNNDFIDMKEIAAMLSIKPKSVYHILNSDNTFPKPIVLAPRIRRWPREEVVKWMNRKIENRS